MLFSPKPIQFNLSLTKSSQQRKTARHYRAPMKSSIVILILHRKKYYRVVTDKSRDFCIFARFKVNYEVTPLRSFANC